MMSETAETDVERRQKGFLGAVEKIGNFLPDPVILFMYLILMLVGLSVVGSALGWSASLSFSGEKAPDGGVLKDGILTFTASNLLSEYNIARLFTEMPRTLTSFAPLGIVIVIMLGAAIAERAGMFSALIRASLRDVSKNALTPIVVIIGMVSHHASDAAYVVFIPLAALIYAAAGRHPLAGLATAMAAVSGGFAGNLMPGQMDVVLFGFTQEAARIIDPNWTMNPLGNWWFILAVVVVFTPIAWFLTDKIVEPRLGPWGGVPDEGLQAELARSAVTAEEKKGLRNAGFVALAFVAFFAALALLPGYTPFIDESKTGTAQLQPLYASLIAGFALLFALSGIAFGIGCGTIKNAPDAVAMMVDGIKTMAPYIVFVFFAAHFIAMFNWSRLGPIAAINGAEFFKQIDLPSPILLVGVLGFSSFLDLFIGSATAKWSALSPVVVPMFMLLGISPEMTTAAYRMGDSFTNIMTPLMSYFPLVLAFARRWDKSMGVGSLLALMLPYGLSFMVAGITMTALWVVFDIPPGPGATVHYTPPGGLLP